VAGKDSDRIVKALILDGELAQKKSLERVRDLLIELLTEAGYELNTFRLREMDIAPCQGCFGCWVRNPGECLVQDDSQLILRVLVRSELLVLLTPVTFGGYSSELKKALDRSICLISPYFMKFEGETHHKPRYGRLPHLLGVGVAETQNSESEQIFKSLVHRNSINFHSPSHSAAVIDVGADESKIRLDLDRAIEALEVVE
jgi:multimeric flavodoxin WrbA